jgi:hypothetical protein
MVPVRKGPMQGSQGPRLDKGPCTRRRCKGGQAQMQEGLKFVPVEGEFGGH